MQWNWRPLRAPGLPGSMWIAWKVEAGLWTKLKVRLKSSALILQRKGSSCDF